MNPAEIHVSEDRLRAVLAEFELRLLRNLEDKFERKADLVLLDETRRDVAALKTWQSWMKGAIAVLGALWAALLVVVVHYLP